MDIEDKLNKSVEKAIKNPWKTFFKVVGVFIIISLVFTVVSGGLGFIGNAQKVAQKEFSPEAMLKKYEWFKDASYQIEKKDADIQMYGNNLSSMTADYVGTKRRDWDRTDKEQFNQWRTELAGIKASYNGLVAEYNSQSSKFNWGAFNTENIPTTYKQQ